MAITFLNKTIHAYLDYPVATGLIAAPYLLGLGADSGSALPLILSVMTGVAAFALTLFTDHHLGALRVIPFWLHELVDGLVGVTFILVPFAFGFAGLDAAYFWIVGATVLVVLALTDRQQAAGSL